MLTCQVEPVVGHVNAREKDTVAETFKRWDVPQIDVLGPSHDLDSMFNMKSELTPTLVPACECDVWRAILSQN